MVSRTCRISRYQVSLDAINWVFLVWVTLPVCRICTERGEIAHLRNTNLSLRNKTILKQQGIPEITADESSIMPKLHYRVCIGLK